MNTKDDLKPYGWLLSKVYTLMIKFSDNGYIMEEFRKRVDKSMKILEIGSGPGKDYEVLAMDYNITGSDYSDTFLKILRKKFKNGRFLKINALTMDIEEKFDVIYSNKVLHHLTEDQLETSLKRQYETLNAGGIVFHAMWKGNTDSSTEKSRGKSIPDIRYEKENIEKIKGDFKIMDFIVYGELTDYDSFIMVLKKYSNTEDLL